MNEDSLLIKQKMGIRKLAKQFRSIVESTSSSKILVTSVQSGDGKAKFINELHAELIKMGEPTFAAVEAEKLETLDPLQYDKQVVVVYGPAYLESFGLHMLPEKWLNAFDAAVVIVMVRSTSSQELAEMLDWLKEYGIEQIWLVWNEFNAPSQDIIWHRFRESLAWKKLFGERKMQVGTTMRKLRDSWGPLADKLKRTRPIPPKAMAMNVVPVEEEEKLDTQAVLDEEERADAEPEAVAEAEQVEAEPETLDEEERADAEPEAVAEEEQADAAEEDAAEEDAAEEDAAEEDAAEEDQKRDADNNEDVTEESVASAVDDGMLPSEVNEPRESDLPSTPNGNSGNSAEKDLP